MQKIRSGDEVVVLVGKDRGKRGKVSRILPDGRVLVAGVNIVKKHQRPNPQLGVQGGIIEREAPIQGSNVALYNPATSKGDRVGFRFLDDGRKVRVFKSTGEVIDA